MPALREVLGQLRSRAVRVVSVDTAEGVADRAEPAVQLDRRVHVRGRRAAGRAAGRRAGPRPRPARATCSAPRSCASCSTPACSPTSSSTCSASPTAGGPAPPTSCTTCCAGSATSRRRGRPALRGPRGAAHAVAGQLLRAPSAGRSRSTSPASSAFAAADDAARYRDALGCSLPLGLPQAFTEPVPRPLEDLVARYARTHGPFVERRGRPIGSASPEARVAGALGGARGRRARRARRVPARRRAPRVVRRRRAPPAAAALAGRAAPRGRAGRAGGARPLPAGVARHPTRAAWARGARRGARHAAGAPIVASTLEPTCSGARPRVPAGRARRAVHVRRVVWVGAGAIGSTDGRVRLCFADQLPLLAPALGGARTGPTAPLHDAIRTRAAPSGAPASGSSSAPARPARPTTSCWPRCGTWCGPARSPTTRWRRCAPSTTGRGARPDGTRRPGHRERRPRPGRLQPHRPAGRRRALEPGRAAARAGADADASRRTPRRCSWSSGTASSPARPCWPRAWSAGTPRCTAC